MLIDFILWPHMERISVIHKLFPKMGLTADKFPCLHSWVQRMRSVPAVIKAMIPDHLHVEFLKQYANGTPDYDLGLN